MDRCRQCQHELKATDAYCGNCGKLTEAARQQFGGRIMVPLRNVVAVAAPFLVVGGIVAFFGIRMMISIRNPTLLALAIPLFAIGAMLMMRYFQARGIVKRRLAKSDDYASLCEECGDEHGDDAYCVRCGKKR